MQDQDAMILASALATSRECFDVTAQTPALPTEAPAASRGGVRAGALLAGSVGLLALPSAVMAFSASFHGEDPQGESLGSLESQASGETLSRAVAMRSLAKGGEFAFTPAGTPHRPERSVLVVVRDDPVAAKAIIVRGRYQAPKAESPRTAANPQIAASSFSLGMSRGYQNFAQDLVKPSEKRSVAALPDLQSYSLSPGTKEEKESRFTPRISIDEKRAAGRAPRTFAGIEGEVDLGGAYRVAKNLNVTAGVRYSQDRERLQPLTDGRQDSQAVYVGTQFSF
ncbi:hypothetical protein [Novosphingobium profundi]|uniref:hypothetical protein n=1 Tax=Novosphingobium profundi TaxID=1774954 RepID=UPI001CFDE321|nr:hypothetical protein [Novosphingobium profundi]